MKIRCFMARSVRKKLAGQLHGILSVQYAVAVHIRLQELTHTHRLKAVIQAVIQPVTDKRLLDGMESMTQGVGMLLQVLIGCVLMFILSLAVVCNAASVIDI